MLCELAQLDESRLSVDGQSHFAWLLFVLGVWKNQINTMANIQHKAQKYSSNQWFVRLSIKQLPTLKPLTVVEDGRGKQVCKQ